MLFVCKRIKIVGGVRKSIEFYWLLFIKFWNYFDYVYKDFYF